jgi:hypothetical protein
MCLVARCLRAFDAGAAHFDVYLVERFAARIDQLQHVLARPRQP